MQWFLPFLNVKLRMEFSGVHACLGTQQTSVVVRTLPLISIRQGKGSNLQFHVQTDSDWSTSIQTQGQGYSSPLSTRMRKTGACPLHAMLPKHRIIWSLRAGEGNRDFPVFILHIQNTQGSSFLQSMAQERTNPLPRSPLQS